jgi:hypothetical protein
MGRHTFLGVIALGFLTVCAVAASAAFGSSLALDDGCLVARDAKGTITINLKSGFVLGRFDQGQITVIDPTPTDTTIPKVTGWDKSRPISETKSRYVGDQVRFRASGPAILVIQANLGIYVSLVGKGGVTLSSNGFDFAGDFSVDADSFCSDEATFQQMPSAATKYVIGGPA